MIFKYNLCDNILNSQNVKYPEQLQDFPEEKVRKRSESNQIPLYLSNSSFQFEQKQRNKLDQIDQDQLDYNLNEDQQQLSYSSLNEETNHKQQQSNSIPSQKNQFVNEQDVNNSSSSAVLCRNRKLFTQKSKSRQRTYTEEKEPSNKQERLYSLDKCPDNLFTIFNPQQDLEEQNHLHSVQKQISNQKTNSISKNNIIQNNNKNNETQQSSNQIQKRDTYTNQTSEDQDDYNQDFYLTNTVEQNNLNNICDITTITDSVQDNEDYKIFNYNCMQKKKINNEINTSDKSFEIDFNKLRQVQAEMNNKKLKNKDKRVDEQIRVLNNTQSQCKQNESLSQIIHDKEKELINLREQKRMREEINKNPMKISIQEYLKLIKELKNELSEKEITIIELKNKIKIYETNTQNNEKQDKIQLIIKGKDQIIMELQKEIKNKICDQESYKDKIKLYHEQSVKQQTNDILICQLNSTIKQQQYQIDKFEMMKTQKDDSIQTLENQLNQIKSQNKQNQEELLKYKNENYELCLLNKDLEKNFDSIKKKLIEIRQNFDILDQENSKLKDLYTKKVQEFNQIQEIKICNEIDKKIGQTSSYQFSYKDNTLGKEQMKVQFQQANQYDQCYNDRFDYPNEQQQIEDQYFMDNSNNTQQNKMSNFNSSQQNLNSNMNILNQDNRQMKSLLYVSAINLNNEVCDIDISPTKIQYQPRQKERNYSQQNNLLSCQPLTQTLNQNQNQAKSYDNESLKKLNQLQDQNLISRPRHQRSYSSYDNYTRPSSSLTNYSNIPSSQNLGKYNYSVHKNSYENSIQYNTQQLLQETNINNNHFQTANNFYVKNTENNQNQDQFNYMHPSQTTKQMSMYQNKENILQSKQPLNQIYEYTTHIRNNSSPNSTLKYKQSNSQTNERLSQSSYSKFRYGVSPLPLTINHQSSLNRYL